MKTDYLTYSDLIQHLTLRYNLTLTGTSLGYAITACREAYRRLFGLHDWNYFRRFELIHILSPYSAGTVVYTHSSRTLTLTDGVWPSTAAFGEVEINGVHYLVEYRKSDTEVVLPDNFNPASDVASTSYQWFQNRYPLSFEVKDIVEIINPNYTAPLRQIDVRSAMFLQDTYSLQTFPSNFTVFPSQKLPGTREIWFPSSFYTDAQVKIMYDARHIPLKVREESGVEVSVVGQVATFPTGILTSDFIGCVLRVSENEDLPTGPSGGQSENNQDWLHNPAAIERVIVAIDGDTAILSSDVGEDITDMPWTVSQLIDTDSSSMTTLMLRLAEDEYTKTANLGTKELAQSQQLVVNQLIEAQVDDANQMLPQSRYSNWYPCRVADLGTVTH